MPIHYRFTLDPTNKLSLQKQVRQQIIDAIIQGQIVTGERLPSSRELAKQLAISRNTVVSAYHQLLHDGYLIVKSRSGYYINANRSIDTTQHTKHAKQQDQSDWFTHISITASPSSLHTTTKAARNLQQQIQEQIIYAIHNKKLSLNQRLPSSRRLSKYLNVSRNTVRLAYDKLASNGYLIKKPRSGYFINNNSLRWQSVIPKEPALKRTLDWSKKIHLQPSRLARQPRPNASKERIDPTIHDTIKHYTLSRKKWHECRRDALEINQNSFSKRVHHDDLF